MLARILEARRKVLEANGGVFKGVRPENTVLIQRARVVDASVKPGRLEKLVQLAIAGPVVGLNAAERDGFACVVGSG